MLDTNINLSCRQIVIDQCLEEQEDRMRLVLRLFLTKIYHQIIFFIGFINPGNLSELGPDPMISFQQSETTNLR